MAYDQGTWPQTERKPPKPKSIWKAIFWPVTVFPKILFRPGRQNRLRFMGLMILVLSGLGFYLTSFFFPAILLYLFGIAEAFDTA